jgi:hypothetical protein
MDTEEYVATWRYRERMAETPALAARRAFLDCNRPPRRSARGYLGIVLVGVGRWMIERARRHQKTPGLDPSNEPSRT